MAMILLLCVFSMVILPTSGNTSVTNFTNSLKFQQLRSKMSKEKPFITLYNLAVKDCVYECKIRPACEAVNYWNVRRQCELLESDTTTLHDSPPDRPCVYIRKSSVRESPDMTLASLCPAPCALNEVCDVQTGACVIKECRTHTQPNMSYILGNILTVGSRIIVKCNQWFVPTSYPTCGSDGTWHGVSPCVFLFDCGYPPEIPNAVATGHSYERGHWGDPDALYVKYKCDEGYATPQNYSDMTFKCVTDNNNVMWEEPSFTCIQTCWMPPYKEHATVSGGENFVNMTRFYSCLPGYELNVTGTWNETMVLDTTCQPNGHWSPVSFECLPVCGTPPTIANGSPVDMWTDGNQTFLDYGCHPYHAMEEPSNSTTVECVNGTWEAPDFQCIRDCFEPMNDNITVYATLLDGSTLLGSVRTYQCDPGFATVGNNTMTCQASGNWTYDDFVCVPEPCPDGWHKIASSCYKVSDSLTIGRDAIMTYCSNTYPTYNTYMLQLESQEEDVAVVAFLQNNYSESVYCLGLHDPLQNNVWEWMVTTNPFVYNNWLQGQPDKSQQVHATIFVADGYQWRDIENTVCTPICEISLL